MLIAIYILVGFFILLIGSYFISKYVHKEQTKFEYSANLTLFAVLWPIVLAISPFVILILLTLSIIFGIGYGLVKLFDILNK